MKILFFIFCLLQLEIVMSDWYHHTKAFEITVTNFKEVIGKDQNVILDFFTPWCVHCQNMAGEWNKVWEHYNGPQSQRKDILIAKINCGDERNHELCSHSYRVQFFPTILYIPKHQTQSKAEYEGHRYFGGFVQWIDRHCQQEIRIETPVNYLNDHENEKEAEFIQQEIKQTEQAPDDKEYKQELIKLNQINEELRHENLKLKEQLALMSQKEQNLKIWEQKLKQEQNEILKQIEQQKNQKISNKSQKQQNKEEQIKKNEQIKLQNEERRNQQRLMEENLKNTLQSQHLKLQAELEEIKKIDGFMLKVKEQYQLLSSKFKEYQDSYEEIKIKSQNFDQHLQEEKINWSHTLFFLIVGGLFGIAISYIISPSKKYDAIIPHNM